MAISILMTIMCHAAMPWINDDWNTMIKLRVDLISSLPWIGEEKKEESETSEQIVRRKRTRDEQWTEGDSRI